MKLKKLVINNFRNYINEVSFDLSKDIIILYGDNGNGKSSFFDAIEWCITGEISRFALKPNEYKNIVANNNMVIGDECSVAIYFDDYVLKKSFKMNNAVFCNSFVHKIAEKNTQCCHPIFPLF